MLSCVAPRPVQRPTPTWRRYPPASPVREGSRTVGEANRAPPATASSSSRMVVTSGLPKMAPAAAMAPTIIMTCFAGSLGVRMAVAPAAAPSAISGASGPSTAPKPRLAKDARTTEPTCLGPMSTLSPSSGECPPPPGSRMAPAARAAPRTGRLSTSHHGADCAPSCSGSPCHSQWLRWWLAATKPAAAAAATSPTPAPTRQSRARVATPASASGSRSVSSAMEKL